MARPNRRQSPAAGSLTVRLDADSKECLSQAAKLRGISLSDYVRAVIVPQARREVLAARQQTIGLTPEEQLSFWKALAEPVNLAEAQRRLGSLMRGEV